jgi:streptogramin lyase/predicted Ser/Thr protein kinase
VGAQKGFDAAGTEFGGWTIEAMVGKGGMGAVYRAEERGLGRKVALKVISSDLAEDSRFRERFLRESRVAASLDHPHVVPIFQAGEENGALFIAMRYVDGTDLSKLLEREGALAPARAISLLEQVAEALDAAHERGLVHRDVKPSNVLITVAAGKEHCYLADFGLTKRTGSLSGVSAPGDVVGTLEYVAPEQITGGDVEERADVYSLACVLYECVTGQSPFPRATDVALLWAHVHEEPRRPSEVRPELPRPLDAVLSRGLAKDPERRHASAGELVAEARVSLGLAETPPQRPTRRRRIAVGALLAVAATAAGALLLMRGSAGLTAVSPNSVGMIDPATNELVAEVAVGIDPGSVVAAESAVWVANAEDETVTRIDPRARERGRTVGVADFPSDVAAGGGSVWVALGALAEVVRVDPAQSDPAPPFPALDEGTRCGAPGASVAYGGGAVWFVCAKGELGRIEPRTGRGRSIGLTAGVLESTSPVAPEFSDLAFGLGSLWIVNRAANTIVEVDPATNRKQRELTVGRAPDAIAVGANALWVANFEDDTVSRLAIAGRGQPPITRTFPVGDGPVDVAVGEGGVWVASKLDRAVTRLDPATGQEIATIELGNEPQRLAAGLGGVWVSVRAPEAADG